jgi:hypothetical protein
MVRHSSRSPRPSPASVPRRSGPIPAELGRALRRTAADVQPLEYRSSKKAGNVFPNTAAVNTSCRSRWIEARVGVAPTAESVNVADQVSPLAIKIAVLVLCRQTKERPARAARTSGMSRRTCSVTIADHEASDNVGPEGGITYGSAIVERSAAGLPEPGGLVPSTALHRSGSASENAIISNASSVLPAYILARHCPTRPCYDRHGDAQLSDRPESPRILWAVGTR